MAIWQRIARRMSMVACLGGVGLGALLAVQASEDQQQLETKGKTGPVAEINRMVTDIGSMFHWRRPPGDDSSKAKKLFADLKTKFPTESMAQRLNYEAAARKMGLTGKRPSADAGTWFKQFNDAYPEGPGQEDDFDPWVKGNRTVAVIDRETNLKNLHTKSVQEFADAMGFGSPRMVRFHNREIAIETTKIPLPTTSWSASEDTELITLPRTGGVRAGNEPAWPSETVLGGFHLRSQYNFLDPLAFGWVKDREHVVGFVPHFFRSMPTVEPPPENARKVERPQPTKERWVVRRVELVSLLKEEKPAVYVADFLPNLGEFKDAERRPLGTFEDDAVGRLRKGDELVTEATTNRIVMVGAIRAATQCMKCHDVERGDLLGALSYELLRDPAIKK